MGSLVKYKGYYAKIEYSSEDRVLHGKIEGIHDLVTFESDRAEDIENEFHLAVDDYLDFCEQIGQNPDKSYSGSFNIRIAPELHKKVAMYALKNSTSINNVVEEAIESLVEDDTREKIDELWQNYQAGSAEVSEYRNFSNAMTNMAASLAINWKGGVA